MPELPEVETIRRDIEPYLIGSLITRVIIRNCYLRQPISDEIKEIKNEIVLKIQRLAKYLLLKISNKGWIIIHLGMSGKLRVISENLPINKHDHIDLIINNNKIIRYTDPRKFGFWIWVKDLEKSNIFTHLGVDPLSNKFDVYYLQNKFNKKTSIKHLLMNNRVLTGIGNIYANESLFAAKIHPNRSGFSLSLRERLLLVKSIKSILQCSIELGGTTLKDFLRIDGKEGLYTKELQVYGRKGKPCLICKTQILALKQAQRSTFFCPKCQK